MHVYHRPPTPIYSACLAAAGIEWRVLNLLLPHRRLSAAIVAAAGLTIDHFQQDDHRLLYAAWLIATERDLPLVTTLRLARRALQAAGLWDPMTPAGSTGMRHSDRTLAAIGTHHTTREELDHAAGRGPDADPLPMAIARHVVALIDAAEALKGAAA
jgi:hypothetical protein